MGFATNALQYEKMKKSHEYTNNIQSCIRGFLCPVTSLRFEFASRNHVRNSHYQFCPHEHHRIECLTPHFTKQKLEYIHDNPVLAGWV